LRLEDGEVCIFTPQKATRKVMELVNKHLPEERSLCDELIEERGMED